MLGHIVQAILAPVLVFGLVIFVHEFGHFIAAKALGVYAPRFSIGFGPAIYRRRQGETEYVLAWLPLGGYVRMASRHDAEAAFLEGGNEEANARSEGEAGYDPNAMIPFGPKPVPENRWFESKPLWARVIIMSAGVAMNVVLALSVATWMAFHYGVVVTPPFVVGGVRAPAFSAGAVATAVRRLGSRRERTERAELGRGRGSCGRVRAVDRTDDAARPIHHPAARLDDAGDGAPVVDPVHAARDRHGVSERPRDAGRASRRRLGDERRWFAGALVERHRRPRLGVARARGGVRDSTSLGDRHAPHHAEGGRGVRLDVGAHADGRQDRSGREESGVPEVGEPRRGVSVGGSTGEDGCGPGVHHPASDRRRRPFRFGARRSDHDHATGRSSGAARILIRCAS